VPTEIERLYREHRAGLVRLVERELHDHHDAEDVVQTAFLDAQRALKRGTIPRNPPAWLAAIALNAARRLRRRRLNAEPLEEYAVREAAGMSEIRAALASLPREQRAAVLYRDMLGLSYGETAEQMGRSVNAVTMLLYRGRQRLRQTLGVTPGGLGLWRWSRHAGTPQVAVVKGAAVIVLAAGLATGGVVAAGRAARAIAPGTDPTAALPTRSGSLTAGAGRTPGGALALDSARRHFNRADGSSAGADPASTHGSGGAETPASGRSSTADAVATPPSSSLLRVPSVSLPTLSTPTLPATVAATVTVTTPVTTATVTASVGTTVTVTTPITTVTLPVP
jgi:RNA polymerase sigma-70 factor (ECF subfamily)